MGISIPPEKPWHMQKTPEEWQEINRRATMDLRHSLSINPNAPNRDALEAIKDSNDALNAYDAPAIEAGKHVLPTGYGDPVEALKGEAEGFAGAIGAPFHLANTLYRQGAGAGVDEIINGLTSIPGEITSGDPRRIGGVAGNVAGGIAVGRLGTKLAKTAGGAVSNLAERPALKNSLLRAQTQQALHGVEKSGGTLSDAIKQAGLKTQSMEQNLAQKAELHPDKVEQAGLKNNKLHQDIAQKAGTIKPTVDQANLKTDLMKQQLEKGATDLTKNKGTINELIKRAGLQNQLTELQIEKLRRALEGDEDIPPDDLLNPQGPGPTPTTNPPGSPPPTGQVKFKSYDELSPEERDPYGLDNPDMNKPTPPQDQLGQWINELKEAATRGAAPHDILGGNELNNGPKPLTPEQINQLLKDITGGNMSK